MQPLEVSQELECSKSNWLDIQFRMLETNSNELCQHVTLTAADFSLPPWDLHTRETDLCSLFVLLKNVLSY